MLWILLSVIFSLNTQQLFVASLPLELVPEDDKCDDVMCPELNCTNATQKEGDCCRSCIILEDCIYDGEKYEELSMVPLNQSDSCEVCHCYNGEIICANISESCPHLKCNETQQIHESENCCPQCFNENPVSSTQGGYSYFFTCEENGIIYYENDTWNPYYVTFGVVKCLNCTCKNGTSLCMRSPCSPVRVCTSDDPIEVEEIYCCPKCNRTLNNTIDGGITYVVPTLDPSEPPESNTTCPLVYSHKVYETAEEQYDQVAIEDTNSSRVLVYVWVPGITFYTESYSSKDFSDQFINTRFKFIGNTTAELVKTINEWLEIKEMEHSLVHCESNCSAQVLNLLLQPCN